MSALAMAICIRGMNLDETRFLTRSMLATGTIMKYPSLCLPKIDKHSTGGIGDKVSLVLAPLAAACGMAVPMIAGRGLGITGGTLDKLESIPGFRVDLAEKDVVRVVKRCGCCIAGATARLAPADKKLYALRDVTGTVPSVPLIVASILSKKLAAGLDGIVFDVKCGSGAFMQSLQEATRLAENLVKVGVFSGLRAQALITDMNQPLGCAVGNAREVLEAVEVLRGGGPRDVIELTLALGVKMLMLAGLERRVEPARAAMLARIKSGAAFEKFKEMVRLQGGDASCLDRPDKLVRAKYSWFLKAPKAGYVTKADAGLIGKAALILGAGRSKLEDAIDRSAGVIVFKKRGDRIERGEPLARLEANLEKRLVSAKPFVAKAFAIGQRRVAEPRLIIAEI